MTKELERALTKDELQNMTQTIVLKKKSPPEGISDRRPKVRYVAAKDTSVLKIMGGAAYALEQRGLHDRANDLRRLILSGTCETPAEALALIGDYVRLKIVDEEGQELGSTG